MWTRDIWFGKITKLLLVFVFSVMCVVIGIKKQNMIFKDLFVKLSSAAAGSTLLA